VLLAHIEDAIRTQIRIGRSGVPNVIGLVGVSNMERMLIGRGVNSDGGDPQLPAGSSDANCDFTAVGYQNSGEDSGGTRA
jgi:hypothetical protein